jgi:hypothetical protein
MAFLPNIFLSNINNKGGLAKPNRFQVILPIPRYINEFIGQSVLEQIVNLPNTIVSDITNIFNRDNTDEQSKTTNSSISRYLALQCESTELPGKSILTQDAKVYGPTYKIPYQTQFADISLTFLCTNDFYERKLFDRWIEAIMPNDTHNLRFSNDDATRYLTNLKIIQYDDFIKQIYAVEMIDAFPISIASQPLNWGEDSFHRLTVQFSYRKYKTLYQGKYDADAVLGAALISGVPTEAIRNQLRGIIPSIRNII